MLAKNTTRQKRRTAGELVKSSYRAPAVHINLLQRRESVVQVGVDINDSAGTIDAGVQPTGTAGAVQPLDFSR